MNRIGIDLGGTKTEGVLLDEDYSVIQRRRVPTPRDYHGILECIRDMVRGFGSDRHTVGVCSPGSVSARTGLVRNSNTACLIGRPFRADLERLLGCKISLENDANCFALAEARAGAARGYGTVFGIIMGTGVGGGIVIDGSIHAGRTGIAGEWGHHVLHPGGRPCYCGSAGCAETYISGPALERRWTELTGESASLADIPDSMHARNARRWKSEFLDDFSSGVANVIDILDPDAVVLGGGVSNIDFLYTEGRDLIHQKVFSDHTDTPVLKNSLGDSSGVIGACMTTAARSSRAACSRPRT